MDAYNKVLTRIYQMTGGKDNVDVDLTELLKKEGFLPSIDDIKGHMCRESWVTETKVPNVVRITHWGVGAAKRAGSQLPGGSRAIERETNDLHANNRQMGVLIEEFRAEPGKDRLKPVEEALTKMREQIEKLKGLLQ